VQLNLVGINSILRTQIAGYLIYIVMGFVALAVMLVTGPIMHVLLFCPMETCLRKKLAYSRCEELWPAVVLFVLGLGVIGVCTVGLLSDYRLYGGY
jgi:hypothetical protein